MLRVFILLCLTTYVMSQNISPMTSVQYAAGNQLMCSDIANAPLKITLKEPRTNDGCFRRASSWNNGYCLASCDQARYG